MSFLNSSHREHWAVWCLVVSEVESQVATRTQCPTPPLPSLFISLPAPLLCCPRGHSTPTARPRVPDLFPGLSVHAAPPPPQQGFPGGSDGKESACNEGDPGFDPWVGKIPWRREWQYSCLENPMDRGAWQAIVHGVTKGRTQLSNYHFNP